MLFKLLFATFFAINFLGCATKKDTVRSNDDERALKLVRPENIFHGKEKRVALVIGNSDYQNIAELKNPINDSRQIRRKLEKLGFEVIYLENASLIEMKKSLRDFEDSFSGNSVALFYYAGHGVEYGGENFLIPIDANLEKANELEFEAFSLNRLLSKFEESGNRLNIAILDSCRDNPFRAIRGVGDGLATSGAKGTFIAYATSPGSVAEDGKGDNGLFTKHILQHIDREDVKIEDIFKDIAKAVSDESGGTQIPWRNSSIVDGDFYFVGDGISNNSEKPIYIEKEKIVKVVDNSEIERLKRELAEKDRLLQLEKEKKEKVIYVSDADKKEAKEWFRKGYYAKTPEKQIEYYSRAIELNPKYANAFYNRGLAYYNLGKYNLAISDYNRAIELNPKYASAFNNRGWAYRQLGDLKKAKADAIRASELGTNSLMNYMKNNGLW
jgi:tetratricopeptide (TPR) repeat protein